MIIPSPAPKINLHQLQSELQTSGVQINALGMHINSDQSISLYTYDSTGTPTEFDSLTTPKIQTVLSAHKAMRPITNDELHIQYEDANNRLDKVTMQNLVAMAQGLVPRTQVPM